jgi:hypothetical protein
LITKIILFDVRNTSDPIDEYKNMPPLKKTTFYKNVGLSTPLLKGKMLSNKNDEVWMFFLSILLYFQFFCHIIHWHANLDVQDTDEESWKTWW